MAVSARQISLFDVPQPLVFGQSSGTFANNHTQSIHRWFPYIEGYSYDLVRDVLDSLPLRPSFIYDPFAGSGTTLLVASEHNIPSGYAEVNPFMRLVTECKVNLVKQAAESEQVLDNTVAALRDFGDVLTTELFLDQCRTIDIAFYEAAFPKRSYFDEPILRQVLTAKYLLERYPEPARRFLLLALASVLVQVSNLIRRADLRYRRPNELAERADLIPVLRDKVLKIATDLSARKGATLAPTILNGADAREYGDEFYRRVDVIITSPPYLNGTNYFRNTKLELWLCGLLESESDLKAFRTAAITAGINNVSARIRPITAFPQVEECASRLDAVAYDPRIPTLVRAYFSDMYQVFQSLYDTLRPGGKLFLDIGDSVFAGVHVPTHDLLASLGQEAQFEIEEQHVLRQRHSNSGAPLTQVLLEFSRPYGATPMLAVTPPADSVSDLRKKAMAFERELPFQKHPYSKRNWGHELHSLCSYQGKLKPAIAHFLVANFTKAGDVVLDPLAGVGTIPFEACLQGRVGMANDLNYVAYANCLAKVAPPTPDDAQVVIDRLQAYIDTHLPNQEDIEAIDLSINGPLQTYYHVETLREIVAARRFFLARPISNPAEALVYASLLHILHGNRPYALSRRSHPITPFSPTGPYEYRPLIRRLADKALRSAAAPRSDCFQDGRAIYGPFEELAALGIQADAVITSPPFFGSTRFYLANWLRLWFSGWEKDDFSRQRLEFLETRQQKNMDVYRDFFAMCEAVLKPRGLLIIHLGKSRRCDMAMELIERLPEGLELAYHFDEDVSLIEKHGVSDKGVTHMHQFLFIVRR